MFLRCACMSINIWQFTIRYYTQSKIVTICQISGNYQLNTYHLKYNLSNIEGNRTSFTILLNLRLCIGYFQGQFYQSNLPFIKCKSLVTDISGYHVTLIKALSLFSYDMFYTTQCAYVECIIVFSLCLTSYYYCTTSQTLQKNPIFIIFIFKTSLFCM